MNKSNKCAYSINIAPDHFLESLERRSHCCNSNSRGVFRYIL